SIPNPEASLYSPSGLFLQVRSFLGHWKRKENSLSLHNALNALFFILDWAEKVYEWKYEKYLLFEASMKIKSKDGMYGTFCCDPLQILMVLEASKMLPSSDFVVSIDLPQYLKGTRFSRLPLKSDPESSKDLASRGPSIIFE
ncbi:hypothetical protein AMTR_s00093p00042570, partial [Amborella trichopoda]